MSKLQARISQRKRRKSSKSWEIIGGTTRTMFDKQQVHSRVPLANQVHDMDKILVDNYGITVDEETERFFDDLYRQYFQDFFRQLVLDYVKNR